MDFGAKMWFLSAVMFKHLVVLTLINRSTHKTYFGDRNHDMLTLFL